MVKISKIYKNKNMRMMGAIAAVVILLMSVVVLSLGAENVSAAPTGYSYSIAKDTSGKTVVKNAYGSTKYSSTDSKTAIQWAIDKTPAGSSVLIKAGRYTLNSALAAKSGVTIAGEGDKTVLVNGEIDIQASKVTVKSLRMEGTCHLVITPRTADISDVTVQDVSATVGAVESAFSVLTNSYKVSNVNFIRDTVANSGSNGFLLSGSALISNVYFESCKATGSGLNNRYNDWIYGFILAQNAEVSNIKVVKSEASNSWESGFFLKPSVKKTNVVLQDCIANNNGQKTNCQEGYGFYLDSTVSLINIAGTGNKAGLSNLATPPAPGAKGTSSIAISLVSSSVQTGATAHATGTLKGTSSSGTMPLSGVPVSLQVVLPSGATVSPTQGSQIVTDANGAFAIDYVPSVAGTYKLVATFAGNPSYNGTTASASLTATATPPPAPVKSPSSMSLSPASASVETNKNMRASGVLSGTTGIPGATVSLKVTLPNGAVANPTQGATVVTDSSGKFVMDYVPLTAGTYKFTATFAGNTNYDGSTITVSFTATTPPVTAAYDYTVSSNVVKTASGSTAYTGSSFTAALQWAVSQTGKTTYVPAGTYTVTGKLNMASGTTLMGAGDSATGTVFSFTSNSEDGSKISLYNVNGVTLKQFRFTGNGGIQMIAEQTTCGGHLIQDVTAYQTSNIHEAAFQSLVLCGGTGSATMNGLTFIRCEAINVGCMGFQLHGDGWKVPGGSWQMRNYGVWTKNVYFEDCVADRCGINSRFNDWVVGIDIAELTNVDNVKLVRCTASNNWESGFHAEPMPAVLNVVMQDCVANNNGQKPSSYYNQETDSYGPLFGAGYFLGRGSESSHYTLTNCVGTGNPLGTIRNYVGPVY